MLAMRMPLANQTMLGLLRWISGNGMTGKICSV